MRLKKAQRLDLLAWIAEGLTSDEINKRAAVADEPFEVSRQHVDFYRKRNKLDIEELRKQADHAALNRGLARVEERVALLQRLADHLAKDLFERKLFWTDQVKGIGSKDDFQVIEYEEFNGAEVAQLRGILDDIAKELGARQDGPQVINNNIFDLAAWKAEREERLNRVRNNGLPPPAENTEQK